MLQGVHVLRMSRRQKTDVARQLKRRENILVSPEGNGAKRVNLCKMSINQCMKEFND